MKLDVLAFEAQRSQEAIRKLVLAHPLSQCEVDCFVVDKMLQILRFGMLGVGCCV